MHHSHHPSANPKVAMIIFALVALAAFAFLRLFASYPSSAPAYPTLAPEEEPRNGPLPTLDFSGDDASDEGDPEGVELDASDEAVPAIPAVSGAATTIAPTVFPSPAITEEPSQTP
jgi:hypothetical protein